MVKWETFLLLNVTFVRNFTKISISIRSNFWNPLYFKLIKKFFVCSCLFPMFLVPLLPHQGVFLKNHLTTVITSSQSVVLFYLESGLQTKILDNSLFTLIFFLQYAYMYFPKVLIYMLKFYQKYYSDLPVCYTDRGTHK